MHKVLVAVLLLLSSVAFGSMPYRVTLEEMAQSADHILVGRVVGVDMVDARGNPVTSGSARTGPGLNNTIRLLVVVDEVLVTNAPIVPKRLEVPLDPAMHFSLGNIKSAHSETSEPMLLMLKGEKFSPILPGVFSRPVSEREAAIKLHAASHP